jgi:hypothetical protein
MVWFAGSRGEAVRCAGAIQARKRAGATNRAQIRHTRPHTTPNHQPNLPGFTDEQDHYWELEQR